MPAVRRSQRNRQQIEPYQAAGPPQLTIRQQRQARARYRKTKEEIVNEEVRKVATSRQVRLYYIHLYIFLKPKLTNILKVELLKPLKKFMSTILNGVMLGSKSIISQTLQLRLEDPAEFFRQIRTKIDPNLDYTDRLVEHYVRVNDFRYFFIKTFEF